MANSDFYRGKLALAPMVRIGTLPIRLLCLDYGADIVYSEERVDVRMLACTRKENSVLHTVDFYQEGEEFPAFRTCAKERDKVVFQLGTADPYKALKVARLVENDVAAIDVNMGCPKSFSVHAGMGAALLERPELVQEILSCLVKNVKIPVSCKIRILPKLDDTLELCKLIQRCGVSALAVHGRLRDERPRHANHDDVIATISQSLNIPIIANGGSGEIETFADIAAFRERTCSSSVMIARAAQRDPSIFRAEGTLSQDTIIRDYLKYAVDYDSNPANAKYVLQQILLEQQATTEKGQSLLAAKSVKDLCIIWDLLDYWEASVSKRRDRTAHANATARKISCNDQKDSGSAKFNDIVELNIAYPPAIARLFPKVTPKCILQDWCKKCAWEPPRYDTFELTSDCKFRAVAIINDKHYSSTVWEKNKRKAEQAAALVAIHVMKLEKLLPAAYLEEYWDGAE